MIERSPKLVVPTDNYWLLTGSLLLFALVLNREGNRMPTGNEFVYLLYFKKAWHPQFLATDWTFQETTAGHAIFNYATGWLTRIMSLKMAAWLGRIGSWIVTIIGLFRLGRHYKLAPQAVWAGIVLWMLQRQSPVTGEWMIGTFEAKVIAYPCLLFAIDAALTGRAIYAGLLAGIAFSFHTAVGLWGGAALGFAILLNQPMRKTIGFSLAAIIFALPGLVTSWPLLFGKHAITLIEAKYLTTVSLPDCFDPADFPPTWMALLLVLPIFTWLHANWRSRDRQVQQLFIFEIALAGFFVFGIFARIIGRYDWIELFPMRVYSVFALLFFYWQAISVVQNLLSRKYTPRPVWILGLFLFLSMPSPVLQLRDMIAVHLTRFFHRPAEASDTSAKGTDADFIEAANWVNAHTPQADVVIAPPWRNDGFYYINRPLIANWHAPRYDRMSEWKDRIEALVGDTSHLTYDDALQGEMDAAAWTHYATLTTTDIDRIRHRKQDGKAWGGNWLITTGIYPYRIAYRTATYRVYQLPQSSEDQTTKPATQAVE